MTGFSAYRRENGLKLKKGDFFLIWVNILGYENKVIKRKPNIEINSARKTDRVNLERI